MTCTTGDAATEGDAATVPFENAYAASGQIEVDARKGLTGRPLVADEFAFSLSVLGASDGRAADPMVIGSARNAADGAIAFDPIAADVTWLDALAASGHARKTTVDGKPAWELSLMIAEDTTSLPGSVVATKATATVGVRVVDEGAGALTSQVTYEGGADEAVLSNTYGSASVVPHGVKQLDYASGLAPNDIAGAFEFTIEALNGGPMPAGNATVRNDAAGNVTFGKITFTLDDLNAALDGAGAGAMDAEAGEPGVSESDADADADGAGAAGRARSHTFTYRVTERGSAPGVQNDPVAAKTFSYTVTDDGAGNLSVAADPRRARRSPS